MLFARIAASPLGYRLACGAFWSLTGAVLARGLGLLSSIIVARMLGKSGFGELGIIQSTLGMLGTFAGFGLGMTATKFIAQYRTTDPGKAGRVRALSSIFAWVTSGMTSLVLFIFAPWLAKNTLAAPHLAEILQIGAIFLLLSAVNGAQIGALSGFEAFKKIAIINLWCGLVNFPLMVGGVYFFGLSGAVIGMIIANGINWLFNHVAIRSECSKFGIPYSYERCWLEKNILWKFALPSVISSLFFVPTEWILNAMLVNQPNGYEQMGILNAAKQWNVLILYIPLALSNMTLPILSNLLGEGNWRQYCKTIVINSLLLSGLAFAVALPVILFSEDIIKVYGHDFSGDNNVLILVCIYSILWASNIVIGQVLWSAGSTGLAMILAAARAALLLICFSYVVPRTAYGMAIAFTITYILQTIYQSIISVNVVKKYFNSNLFELKKNDFKN